MSPLTGFHNKCVELINAAPRTHAVNCFRSALYHLELAELLREVDPAMAIFRGITAEEEAASGVMRCMIEMGYPRSEQLNPRDHAHKHAVYPYLQVLQLFFGQTLMPDFKKYNLHVKEVDGVARLTLALNVKIYGQEQLAYPIPPLNFGVRYPDTDEIPDYSFQINQLVAAKGKDTVKAFLKKEANLRNEILYAHADGYPTIPSLDIGFLVERRSRVMATIYLYLLVYPYLEHQPFVVQALASFVKMLQQLKRSRGNT
jgi:hypothetical protein